jgi:hypothetical protein
MMFTVDFSILAFICLSVTVAWLFWKGFWKQALILISLSAAVLMVVSIDDRSLNRATVSSFTSEMERPSDIERMPAKELYDAESKAEEYKDKVINEINNTGE